MRSTALARQQKSAVPTFYYVVFGIVEPLFAFVSLLEAISDPEKVCLYVGQGCSLDVS